METLMASCLHTTSIAKQVEFKGLKTIWEWSMNNLKAPSIIFPNSLSSIHVQTFTYIYVDVLNFSKCEKITEIPSFMSMHGYMSVLVLPPNIISIKNGAFSNCKKLTSVEIPSKVISIGSSCFSDCSSLSNVTFITNIITSIGINAFDSCNLSSVTIPIELDTLSADLFAGNRNLKSIIFVEGSQLKNVHLGTLRGCDSITSIHFPPSLEKVAGGVLFGMKKLQNITVNSSNPHFESFDGVLYTKNLTQLVAFPSGRKEYVIIKQVSSFLESAFYKCGSLERVTYDGNVSLHTIEQYTFLDCERFEEMDIPKSVVSIKAEAFGGCSKLKNVTFEDGSKVTIIVEKSLERVIFGDDSMLSEIQSNVFNGLKSLTFFKAPSSLRKVGAKAFYDCYNLASFNLFEVGEIGDDAFGNCARLKAVSLGPNLTSLGKGSFVGCRKLELVSYCGSALFPDVIAFQPNSNLVVRVPTTYGGERFAGIPAVRALDKDCFMPTIAFTAGESGKIMLPLLWSTAAPSEN